MRSPTLMQAGKGLRTQKSKMQWNRSVYPPSNGQQRKRLLGDGESTFLSLTGRNEPAPTRNQRSEQRSETHQRPLLSGHAFTAPFLRERWKWTDSSSYWWCKKCRQKRDHHIKECREWGKEIHTLREKAGDLSGGRKWGAKANGEVL